MMIVSPFFRLPRNTDNHSNPALMSNASPYLNDCFARIARSKANSRLTHCGWNSGVQGGKKTRATELNRSCADGHFRIRSALLFDGTRAPTTRKGQLKRAGEMLTNGRIHEDFLGRLHFQSMDRLHTCWPWLRKLLRRSAEQALQMERR